MLSIIVLTKNQEKLIKVCLESVTWADEIVIIDDQSTNNVLEIAKQYTSNIIVHPFVNYVDQRNFAIEHAHGDWVLYLDPDERITKTLAEEVKAIIQSPDACAAYAIPRRNFFLGQEQRQVGGWPDYVIRLLKRSSFKHWEGLLHENPIFEGSLGYTKEPMIHLTHMDITSMTEKTLKWSSVEAQLRLNANHPPMSSWRFFRVVITSFIDWYFKKGGYKAGTTGTIEAIFQTFSVFFSYVRLWEMQQKPSLDEKYRAIDDQLLQTKFGKP